MDKEGGEKLYRRTVCDAFLASEIFRSLASQILLNLKAKPLEDNIKQYMFAGAGDTLEAFNRKGKGNRAIRPWAGGCPRDKLSNILGDWGRGENSWWVPAGRCLPGVSELDTIVWIRGDLKRRGFTEDLAIPQIVFPNASRVSIAEAADIPEQGIPLINHNHLIFDTFENTPQGTPEAYKPLGIWAVREVESLHAQYFHEDFNIPPETGGLLI